jgi:hypothetical protein
MHRPRRYKVPDAPTSRRMPVTGKRNILVIPVQHIGIEGMFSTIRIFGVYLFWPIWILITTTAAICAAVLIKPNTARDQNENQTDKQFRPHAARIGASAAGTSLTLLAVFLVCYIAMILVWEDFTNYDNSFFTLYTLQGHDNPPSIWPYEGRFLPFCFQEFNLVRYFTHTPIGYHILPIIQLLIFLGIIMSLDVNLNIAARSILAIAVLLTPSILISLTGLNYPERNVLFFLVCLILLVNRFEQRQTITLAVAAVVCAQILLYYKETAFTLLLGFATGRLLLRCRNEPGPGWDRNRLWDKESRLDLCFVALAVLFLIFYAAVMGLYLLDGGNIRPYRHAGSSQAAAVIAYAKYDLLAWLFVVVAASRIYLILRYQATPSLLWDGLAVGGVTCFFSYLFLGIFGNFYLAPVDLIAVLYVGRFAILSWPSMYAWSKTLVLLVTSTILLQNVLYSGLTIFFMKNVIHAKSEIASVVVKRYRSGVGDTFRLYFPFANRYVISQFASYLNYRGVAVEGTNGKVAEQNRIILATPRIAKDDRCHGSGLFTCRAANRPTPGDLVIVLPDDGAVFGTDLKAPLAEVSVYRERGELLLSYEPFPSLPHWMYIFAPNILGLTDIPDRWLDGSVTLWK